MRRSGSHRFRFSVLVVLFLVTGLLAPISAAQDTAPETVQIPVAAYLCPSDPGPASLLAGTIPPDCTPIAGIPIFVASADASGACVTDGAGTCLVDAPTGTVLTLTEDTSLLAGATPRENPITVQVAEGVDVVFINIALPPPATEPPPVIVAPTLPPTEVPVTPDPTVPPTPLPTDVPYTPVSTGVPTTPLPTGIPTGTPVPTTVPPTPTPSSTTPVATATATSEPPVLQPSLQQPSQRSTPAPTSTVTPTPTPKATPTTTPKPISYVTVVNTGGLGLRCRTAPNTSATIITVLAEGTRVEVRGAASNGWLPVTCAARDGWMSTSYLTKPTTPAAPTSPKPSPTPAPGGTVTIATVTGTGGVGLNCRSGAGTGYSVITVLREGARVNTRGGTANGWVPVTCAGKAGWVSATYVSLAAGSPGTAPKPTPAPTPATTPAPSGQVKYATVSGTGGVGLNCRTSPVTGRVITVLPEGSRVEVVAGPQNGWAQVKCGGTTGWASASWLLFGSEGGSSGARGEVWIDINLSTQYMVVYRGNTVIGQTYVSTGRPGFDTPTGTYYVNAKLTSQTMSGVLGGEYYYVPDVPWVMYFTNRGHAIHGAYWHNNFGYVMSHGCVNLPVSFAQWLYGISPVGTRVSIHY